ncbi:MAG TPA: hypothetical protein VF669_06480 [Tepidisphaeraceae bacterium]|jgi:hypothetical protein
MEVAAHASVMLSTRSFDVTPTAGAASRYFDVINPGINRRFFRISLFAANAFSMSRSYTLKVAFNTTAVSADGDRSAGVCDGLNIVGVVRTNNGNNN